ncbi:MAG TPA: outer membrane beta-barrel protein [Pseudolabrys sp.]|nr:outer membrane beta-barrel protein [Pseudolabrys sp.]
MKKFVIASLAFVTFAAPAFAADMPVKAVRAPLDPGYNWTGLYIGGQFGGGWAWDQVTNINGDANFPPGFVHNAPHSSGMLGGIYGGYNYQFNRVVIGIDADYSRANITGTGSTVGPTGFTEVENPKLNWVATVTGRVGYAVNDWLIFGKGGWAWVGEVGSGSDLNPAGTLVATNATSLTLNGWTVGAGAEWAFAGNWVAKLEYDYVNIGTTTLSVTTTTVPGGIVGTGRASAVANLQMAKVGLAYRFNIGR